MNVVLNCILFDHCTSRKLTTKPELCCTMLNYTVGLPLLLGQFSVSAKSR